jgi:hypothetical protein
MSPKTWILLSCKNKLERPDTGLRIYGFSLALFSKPTKNKNIFSRTKTMPEI